MSQEFEKKVLEKLDNFEGRFDRIEKTLDEHTEEFKKVNKVLDEHTEEFKKVNKVLDEHTEEFKRVNKVLDEHTEEFKKVNKVLDEHSKQFKVINKELYHIRNDIIKGTIRMEEIEEVVEYNTKLIKKYNEDNSKKIDIALKAYEQLNSRVRVNEGIINNLKTKNFENGVKITALEDIIKQNALTV